MIKVRYLEVEYAEFLMDGVSVTSHRDDVNILQLRYFKGIKVHRIVMFLV